MASSHQNYEQTFFLVIYLTLFLNLNMLLSIPSFGWSKISKCLCLHCSLGLSIWLGFSLVK